MCRKKVSASLLKLVVPSRLLVFVMALFFSISAVAQQVTVTGKVKDANSGDPIPGVSIQVKGTSIGTASNIDGVFSLKVPDGKSKLTFSFIGYTPLEMSLNGQKEVVVDLVPINQKIDEVVVVGYGTQKKANLTGTVNTVKSDAIIGKSVTSLTNALQGTTPGVTIISRPGDVGNDLGNINVRGRGNLGSSSPLFIIDGVPSGEGDFQRINPADVESISVLKDAASSSIYGSRAAYGVFLVTTKKGKDGKMNINYNGYYGLQTPTILPNKLNSVDYATLINEANANAGMKPVYSADELEIIKSGSKPDLYPNTDWYSLVYRNTTPIQEHSLSIQGGGKTRYYVSGSFFNQESLVKGRDLDRYSFRTNTESDFSKYLKMGTNVSFVRDDFSRDGGDFSSMDLDRMTPLTVARHSDGSWGSVTGGKISGVLAKDNPLRKIAEYGRADYRTSRFNGSVNADLKPFDGFKVTGILSYNYFNKNESKFNNEVEPIVDFFTKKPIESSKVGPNDLKNTWETSNTFMAQAFATYEKSIGKHDGALMIGTQYESYQYKWLSAYRKGFPSNSLDAISAGSTIAENLDNGGGTSEKAFLSQFGRFNYSYDGKYLFEANARMDRSSQFHKDHRLGVFPSFSAAWRMSEESFMKEFSWLSNLKLRVSWGKLGNVNNVGYYDFYDALGTGTATIINEGKVDGVWPSKQANASLSWETVTMSNIGVDAAFFNNAVDFQLDVFDKRTSDILLKMPQPFELGLKEDSDANKDERKSTNAGKVTNKGFEFAANYRGSVGELKYTVSGNVSKIWNEVTDLNGLDDQISGDWIYRVGEPIGSFYMYEAEGLFKDQADVNSHAKQSSATKPGDIKYKDINKDGKIDAADKTIVGNDVPYTTYGLSLSASYKGFDLSMQGQGVADVKVYLSGEAALAFYNGAGGKEYHLKRWTVDNPNPNAAYPRILPTANNNHNATPSSFWLYNADYFRIKSLTLGYTFPEWLVNKVKLERARIYFTASNPFTIRGDKRMKDFDPEMPSARGTYPMMKVYSLGLNVTL